MSFHSSNCPTINLGLNEATQALRHEDEQKGGQRVPLANAPSRMKGRSQESIKENIKERQGNQAHNPFNPVGGEALGPQHIFHEFPIELVESFCNVKFNHHPRDSGDFERVQHFVRKNDPIHDLPPLNKT